jgi:hypothetical protein
VARCSSGVFSVIVGKISLALAALITLPAPVAAIGFEMLRPALYPLRADFLPNELQPRLPFVEAGFFLRPELHVPLNEEQERHPQSIVAAFEGAQLEEDR